MFKSRKSSLGIFYVTVFSCLCLQILPQKRDSVEKLLGSLPADTNRVKALNTIVDNFGLDDTVLSLRYNTEALMLAKQLNFKAGIFKAFINLSNYFFDMADAKRSEYYADQALSVADALGVEYKIDALKNKGNVYMMSNQYDNASHYYITALRLADSVKDYFNIAAVNTNLSVLFNESEEFDKALECALKAYQLIPKIESKRSRTNIYSCLANSYYYLMKDDSALKYFNKTLDGNIELNDHQKIAQAYSNIGALYLESGNLRAAEENFRMALEQRIKLNDKQGLLSSYYTLHVLYFREKQYEKASEMLDKGFAYAKQVNSPLRLMDYYQAYSRLYAAMGKFEKAYDYRLLHEAFKDSIFNLDKEKEILNLQTKYESEKKEQQNKLLLEENKVKTSEISRQRTEKYILTASLLVLMITGYLLFTRNRLRNRLRELEATEKLQKERTRISRDLHDNVGAQLSYIISNLPQGSANGGLETAAKSTMQNLRETIWAIHNEQIDYQDFTDRIKKYISMRLENSSMSVKMNFGENNIVFTPAQALNLYRIAQECINNAVKYSDANELDICMKKTDSGLFYMKVSDNGKGFDVMANQKNKESYGLQNMRYRAEEIKAKLSISSTVGIGTSVELTL